MPNDGKPQGPPLATGHAGPILAVAISPDGKTILTGSADKTARLIARSDGKLFERSRGTTDRCEAWRSHRGAIGSRRPTREAD